MSRRSPRFLSSLSFSTPVLTLPSSSSALIDDSSLSTQPEPALRSISSLSSVLGSPKSSFQHQRPKYFRRGSKNKNVKMSDIVDSMHLNLNDAAERLEMSTSNLKKLCRRYKIMNWPARQIIGKNRVISTLRHSLKVAVNREEEERIEQMVKKMEMEIQSIKQSCLPVDPVFPVESSSSSFLPFSAACMEEKFDEQYDAIEAPELSDELLLKLVEEVEEEAGKEVEEIAQIPYVPPPTKDKKKKLGTKRKRQRKISHPSAEMFEVNVVQVNPAFPNRDINPYLASTSNESNIFSSRTSSPSTSFDSNHSTTTGKSGPSQSDLAKRVYPRSFEASGLMKQDLNLYLPFSVNLPPLARSTKVKKHNVVRLLEPDIGIHSKTSYRTFPNASSPSTSIPSDCISHIPSLLLSLNDHEHFLQSAGTSLTNLRVDPVSTPKGACHQLLK